MTAPRCWVCGAPGQDPEQFAGRTTWRIDHLEYCPVWLTVAAAGPDAYPYGPGDYLDDHARSA